MTKTLRMLPGLGLAACLATAAAARAETAPAPSLKDQLSDLGSGDKVKAPAREPMYVVQSRHGALGGRLELGVGGGKQLNASVYVDATERSGYLAYHFGDRVFAVLNGAYVYNEMTDSGERLWEKDGIFPDVALVRKKADLLLGFNAIYGKARITRDTVFYFDQFLALGGGMVEQTNGLETVRTPAVVADLGVSFWFGQHVSLRLGAKDYNYEERRVLGNERIHHLVGYASMGLVVGGAAKS